MLLSCFFSCYSTSVTLDDVKLFNLKGNHHNVVHVWTCSVFFHWKTIELSLWHVMLTSFPCNKCHLYAINHLRSWNKVVWNKLIIVKCNLNKTSTSKRLAKHISISLYAISRYLSITVVYGWMILQVVL